MKLKNKIVILSLSAVILSACSIAFAKEWFRPAKETEKELPAPDSEWEKLIAKFQELQKGNGLNLEGQIQLFDSEKPDVIKEQNTTVMQQKGNQFYYAVAGVRYYCDGNMMVQVDPVNRMVLVSKATQSSNPASQMIPQLNNAIDSTEQGFRITGTVEGDQTERRLIIQNEQTPEIKNYTIIYNPNTYQINGLNIEWRKENYLLDQSKTASSWQTRIRYTYHPSKDLNIDAEIRKIISVEKGKISLIGQEKDYALEVIN